MATQIQVRRDTAANWASNNPALGQGEIGLETDTGKYKIGTGAAWNTLGYYLPSMDAEQRVASSTTAGALTLTAAQLAGGFFVDGATQAAAFTLTTDTAANIAAAFPLAFVNSSFRVRIVNNDQSATGYAATLAGGTGITIQTAPLANPAIGKGVYADFLFIFTNVASGAQALSVYPVGGSSGAIL